jgi:hypothetical protein
MSANCSQHITKRQQLIGMEKRRFLQGLPRQRYMSMASRRVTGECGAVVYVNMAAGVVVARSAEGSGICQHDR